MNSKPVMLFDGDCAFCRRWIRRSEKLTGNHIVYEPYQEALSLFPQLTTAECAQAVQLVLPDDRVVAGAKAVFTALALAGRCRPLLRWYERHRWFARATESCYRFVSRHRQFYTNSS